MKIMQALKKVSGDQFDLDFYGYGGDYMKSEGFSQDFDLNVDQLLDKGFHTYRKSKTNAIENHYKWNPFNMVNKHFMKNADQVFDNMTDVQLPKRIYQSRPDIVLNIGNEYLTMMLMEELKSK